MDTDWELVKSKIYVALGLSGEDKGEKAKGIKHMQGNNYNYWPCNPKFREGSGKVVGDWREYFKMKLWRGYIINKILSITLGIDSWNELGDSVIGGEEEKTMKNQGIGRIIK